MLIALPFLIWLSWISLVFAPPPPPLPCCQVIDLAQWKADHGRWSA